MAARQQAKFEEINAWDVIFWIRINAYLLSTLDQKTLIQEVSANIIII